MRIKKRGRGGAQEKCGFVTFNLVALHIAILHFTYDGDIQDNNNKNNQSRQFITTWTARTVVTGRRKDDF